MPRLLTTDRPETPRSRQLTPEDAGAGVGRALRQFGQQVGQAGQQVTQAVMANRRIAEARKQQATQRAALEFGVALDGVRAEIDADPNIDQREDVFEQRVRELSEQFKPEGDAGQFDFGGGLTAADVAAGSITNTAIAIAPTDHNSGIGGSNRPGS